MKKSVLLIIIVACTLSCCSNSQSKSEKISAVNRSKETWDTYLASYDAGVGSTTLNMDLIKETPKKQFPFLIATGVTFENCANDGLPNKEQLDTLYVISDAVVNVIAGLTASEHVGSFTFQCDKLDYVYVSDTLGIRSKLTELYSSRYGRYESYIRIEKDEKWETYTTFLYPNEEIQEYMRNQEVFEKIKDDGDGLSKRRQFDHFMYFKDEQGRDEFEMFIIENGFEIENKSKKEKDDFPYVLHISRIDSVDIESLTKLTLFLRQSVERKNGTYHGWESAANE